uniref:Peptidase S8 and S53, subtilisin, kexin, sedolisin n=1 Tax=Solibacter usitatus (strain Ellin6076) TaxID=234267 RepID=Q01UW0_SOLUE
MRNRLLPGLFLLSAALLPAAQDRVLTKVDHARTVRMRGQVHSNALPQFDRGSVDPGMAIDHATVLLKPDSSLNDFLANQQLPGSPDYHRFLNSDEFGQRFGLSSADLAKVVSWLQSEGLKVDEVARGRHWITFSGTAAQAARTFHTEFHRFQVEGRMHFGNAGEPAIPAALESVVGGFTGLDDFATHVARPLPQTNLIGGAHGLSPDDFATIYNISPLYAAGIDGTGQKIAIAGEVNLNLTDVRSFRNTFGLPANDPDVILVGRDPGVNNNALLEADLDVEYAGAVARNAKIVYVYAADVFTAARYAIDQNLAPVLSVSFGACEAFSQISYRAVAQQANAQGITFLVASGDLGAATCDHASPVPQASKGAHASFPADLPEVTSVGGTMFNEGDSRYWSNNSTASTASALSYIPEVAWNESASLSSLTSGGGGPSQYFSKPFWQAGPGVPDDRFRDTPDVALASALGHDPYLVMWRGSLVAVGGTSAAAPAFAGIVALLNQSLVGRNLLARPGLGNINPALYRLAQSDKDAFHDITSGDNFVPCVQGSADCVNGSLGYAAGPGYDMATGLGSVDAAKLVAKWGNGDASTTTLSADATKVGAGDTVNLTATVKGVGATPTGTVTFVTSLDFALGSAQLANGSASISATAQSILAGDGKVYALYSGDAVYGSSVGATTIAATPPAAGSLVFVTVTPNPTNVVAVVGQAPLTVVFSEKAGVATTLTSATANGSNLSISSFFGGGSIPANGTLTSAPLVLAPASVPSDYALHFTGQDADGTTWSRDVTLHVASSPGPGLVPAIVLSSSPASVEQNPQADPSCQWSHQITVRETGGYYVSLVTLRQGSNDLSSNIQQLFGTTRLAPLGSLTANICLNSSNAPGNRVYQIAGVSEVSSTVSSSLAVNYTGPATAPATLAVSTKAINLTVADSGQSNSATFDVSFTGGSPQWNVNVLPVKPAWLTVTSSAGHVTLTASAAGLSKGVYNTTLAIEAAGSLPQSMTLPVTFAVGSSSGIAIGGVAHGASFKTAFAPGMVLSVFGSNLAPATILAASIPLPLSLAGVSATVNGVSAPFYFVSRGQINLQVPYETTAGAAVLAINNNGQVVSLPFTISTAAPGIFTANDGTLVPNATGKVGDTLLAFITGDGDQTPTLATGATPAAGTAVSRLPKARLPVSITIGGVPAPVVFNGLPSGLAGVTQLNFTVPNGVGSGVQDVVVTVGSVASPAAKLTIQ